MEMTFPKVVVLGVIAAMLYGEVQHRQGVKQAAKEIEEARAVAVNDKEAIDEKISELSSGAVYDRALEWVLPSPERGLLRYSVP